MSQPDGADILWLAQTKNTKTGNVPTAMIGKTRRESLQSCKGCSQLTNRNCYAWFGTVSWGLAHIQRAFKGDPQKYSFLNAIADRHPDARMVRVSAIGDPFRASFRDLQHSFELSKQLGLAFVGYTHFHLEKGAHRLKKMLMASCDSIEQADAAVQRGWRATAVVPYNFQGKRFTTPAGHTAVICPAQTMPKKITCNDCLLCDASRKTSFQIIAFRDHGPKVRNQIRQMKKLPVIQQLSTAMAAAKD
jgi:hypothetical protein